MWAKFCKIDGILQTNSVNQGTVLFRRSLAVHQHQQSTLTRELVIYVFRYFITFVASTR